MVLRLVVIFLQLAKFDKSSNDRSKYFNEI